MEKNTLEKREAAPSKLPPKKCDNCKETVPEGSIRPWACSDRCYADLLGIDFPGY